MNTLTLSVLGNTAPTAMDVATRPRGGRASARVRALAGYHQGNVMKADLTFPTCVPMREIDHS
jgi:hypothetical protein